MPSRAGPTSRACSSTASTTSGPLCWKFPASCGASSRPSSRQRPTARRAPRRRSSPFHRGVRRHRDAIDAMSNAGPRVRGLEGLHREQRVEIFCKILQRFRNVHRRGSQRLLLGPSDASVGLRLIEGGRRRPGGHGLLEETRRRPEDLAAELGARCVCRLRRGRPRVQRLRAISASRCVEAPLRHRRDSCPSDEVVGGLFCDFE